MDHNKEMPEKQLKVWQDLGDQIFTDDNPGDKKDLMRAFGILGTNGVNQGLIKGYGLYPTFSFLSHR